MTTPETPPRMALAAVLAHPHQRMHKELRDRAAYVHVTGALPSHLRRYVMGLLRAAAQYVGSGKAGLEHSQGVLAIDPTVVEKLDLRDHPLVRTSQRLLADGFHIQLDRSPGDRRPFGKVLLYKKVPSDEGEGVIRVTVTSEGAIKDGWD